MNPLEVVLRTFEEEAERILWLPPITLGYLYLITGWWWHLLFSILSIGGTRLFYDALNPDSNPEDDQPVERLIKLYHSSKTGLPAIVIIIYAIAIVVALIDLWQLFNRTDPVLVGLSIIYWGIGLVVLLNIDSNLN